MAGTCPRDTSALSTCRLPAGRQRGLPSAMVQ
jgi:hypothetical protein